MMTSLKFTMADDRRHCHNVSEI